MKEREDAKMIGIVYFFVIVLANTMGAISGMGGGVIIKPVFDMIGAHNVAAISFYSAIAVFVMALVSTYRQIRNGISIDWKLASSVSIGAVLGGGLGSWTLDRLLLFLPNEHLVQLIQICLTILTLVFAFLSNRLNWPTFSLHRIYWYLLCGLLLGFLASLLGIGGGPINVSLLILLFSLPMKEATVYSIGTIFFSQLAKLVTIAMTTGFSSFDLSVLPYIIAAAIIGGWLGAKFSGILPPEKVSMVFQFVILVVLLINIYNGIRLIL